MQWLLHVVSVSCRRFTSEVYRYILPTSFFSTAYQNHSLKPRDKCYYYLVRVRAKSENHKSLSRDERGSLISTFGKLCRCRSLFSDATFVELHILYL